MPGPIGSFRQFINTVLPSNNGAINAPQQGPAGPPQQTGGTTPGGSLFTDSFGGSAPGTTQRNPLNVPDAAPSMPKGPLATLSREASAKGSMMIGPGGISGSATIEGGAKIEAGIVSLSVAAYTQLDAGFTRTPGTTTFSVQAEVGVKGELEVDTKWASGSVTGQTGVRGGYEVTLPTAAASAITTPEQAAAQLNPTLPQNLPVGATVTLTGEAFAEAGMSLTFKNIAGLFDFTAGLSVERAKGMALSVSKLDDKTVRVTVGPTEAVSRNTEASFGPLGVSDTLSVSGLSARQVDFDISRPEGLAAYNRFLATGELPKNDPAMGTSNAATVEIASESFSREVTMLFDLGEATIESGEYVTTTYDAGGPTEFQYTGTKGPVTFTVSGEWKDPEDPSGYTYAVTLPDLMPGTIEATQGLYPGATGSGETVSVSFTNAEAQQVQQIVKDYMAAIDLNQGANGFPMPTDVKNDVLRSVADAATPEEAMAILLTPTANNDTTTVMYRLHELANFDRDHGSGGPMPGTMTLLPE
ncbi:hypothetical protein [Pyxidicoccus sp. MSG2]|uniref:hypothetical protein n=1 Tax=Pyxidicoccus sp. MSG2 TaxID=2996790 RepID=UPI00226F6B52|nr:hypothetical protein [Pyxidicoccus sp. MSG2]MCY1020242.1 hypothetical protein [Pyxidicoccus sp. MSG2]